MGTITFLLPPDLSPESITELEHAGMIGGQDNMPFAARIIVEPNQLRVARGTDESGYVIAPWHVDGAGLQAGAIDVPGGDDVAALVGAAGHAQLVGLDDDAGGEGHVVLPADHAGVLQLRDGLRREVGW